MAVSFIIRGENKRREETVEIPQIKPRMRSERTPIVNVEKVEPPPENHHSPPPVSDLPFPPHRLRSTVSRSPPYSATIIVKRISNENMASGAASDPINVDDIYFDDENCIIHISDDDEKYAEELQLQEALIYSASSKKNAASSSSLPFSSTSTSQQKQPSVTSEETYLPDILCGICMDNKAPSEMFRNEKVCSHLFCLDCIGTHVSVKIKENIAKVGCPDPNCKGVIGPEVCRSFVPKQVVERWEDALCESLILGTEKFYCPFKDCSAMLVDDGGKAVTSSECPNCNRLFCAQCKVAWHSGMDCMEFKNLNKDERNSEDIMLMNLAKNRKWKRCPSCKVFVEKQDGCNIMNCRCRCEFCYVCGQKTQHHRCKSCVLW